MLASDQGISRGVLQGLLIGILGVQTMAYLDAFSLRS